MTIYQFCSLLLPLLLSWKANAAFLLHPSDIKLNETAVHCQYHGCPPIFGYTTQKLALSPGTINEIKIDFEFCSMALKNLKAEENNDAAWGQHLIISKNRDSVLHIDCPNGTNDFYNFIPIDENQQFNLKLRKINGTYTHYGKLKVGVMFIKSESTP